MRITGMEAAWGDADADGSLDLVVTGFNVVRLYKKEDGALQRGDSLTDVEGFAAGPAWGDGGGDLDLDIRRYVAYRPREGDTPTGAGEYGIERSFALGPSSFAPQSNPLFRNDRTAGFVNVTEAFGGSNPKGRGLGALWHHFDDDGDDGLLITHWAAQENALHDSLPSDLGPPAGRASPVPFMDVADIVGLGQVALQRVGWGAAFANFEHDGGKDIVVANGSIVHASSSEDESASRTLRPQASFLFWHRDGEACDFCGTTSKSEEHA